MNIYRLNFAALLRDRGDPKKSCLQGAGWVFSGSPRGAPKGGPPKSLYIKDRFSAKMPPSQMEKLSIGGKFSKNSTFLGGPRGPPKKGVFWGDFPPPEVS